ncbi:hypothetical protein [Halomonas sp. I5-271120]|uniref:hypothetical protein n=1 Tax=Halomonas sp. I5-271120 TaxID=3061632 RepID=UPI00271485CD|nr:hypothetical protein [Halomonas sp. I5-271120]
MKLGTISRLTYRAGLVEPGTYEIVKFLDDNGNVVVKNVMTGVNSVINTSHLKTDR